MDLNRGSNCDSEQVALLGMGCVLSVRLFSWHRDVGNRYNQIPVFELYYSRENDLKPPPSESYWSHVAPSNRANLWIGRNEDPAIQSEALGLS